MACFVIDVPSTALSPSPLPSDQVVDGAPATAAEEFPIGLPGWESLEVGVWEHTAGTSTDVEADEVFVVISGSATIAVAGGPTLEVGPGSLGVLEAGAATTWTVHRTLRKIYVTPR
jgi:uncharacterized cupin superfamily protein